MHARRIAGLLSILTAGCTLVLAGHFDHGQKGKGIHGRPGDSSAAKVAPFRAGSSDGTSSDVILAFGTMYGVDGPFVGDLHAIRDVPGDELPWVINGSIKGRLETDGRLRIHVRGLVFKEEFPVPIELQGTNDETEFRGLVSCLTELGEDLATANVMTAGFPATIGGDADIDETLELPDPCVAPIVMVLAGSEDKWFAVTGFEAGASGNGSGNGNGDETGDDDAGDDEGADD
jgi:hypothetical protein